MERRNFFKLLGVAMLPLPETAKSLTITPPVIINPYLMGTIDYYLFQEADRITAEIGSLIKKRDI